MLIFLMACAGSKSDLPETSTDSSEPAEDCADGTATVPVYRDADGDGHGDSNSELLACDVDYGYVTVAGDCDDADYRVYPGATEAWYDGLDGDCSGGSDYDQDGDGHDADDRGGDDCDDLDPDSRPGATEVWYDDRDQDCAGGSDHDQDGDGFDAPSGGGDDCDDTNIDIAPGASDLPYDGVDSDCSGLSDFDQDRDGADAAEYGGDDCDDTRADLSPWADELACTGVDENCDGEVDEEQIVVLSGADWLTSSVAPADWTTPGFDDSAWLAAVAPAPEDCGWTFTPDYLGRGYEAWEHPDALTMWSASPDTVIYLRKRFTIPEGASVSSAMMTTIVDDDHVIHLNGVEVNRETDGVTIPITYTDLSAALLPGENTLAIEAIDTGGCRWGVLSLTVTCGG